MFRFGLDPPKREGRPWTEKERAMVAASRTELLAFLRATVATWARPDAIFDLVPAEQYMEAAGVLDLNPIGRRQTKMYQPKVPVAKQFAPILKAAAEREQRTFLANATIRHSWEAMRAQLNLPGRGEAGPKLIRRSMATIARLRLGEEFWGQGRTMLGHIKSSVSDIYAIPNAANLGRARAVTEAIIDESEALAPGAFTHGTERFYRTFTALGSTRAIGQEPENLGFLRPNGWSGRRESNPRRKLGKLLLCH